MNEFFAMGGYGAYVWSAYGISALLIIGNIVLAVRQQGRVRQEIQRRLRRDQRPAHTAVKGEVE